MYSMLLEALLVNKIASKLLRFTPTKFQGNGSEVYIYVEGGKIRRFL